MATILSLVRRGGHETARSEPIDDRGSRGITVALALIFQPNAN
jgi:hypothetical protein